MNHSSKKFIALFLIACVMVTGCARGVRPDAVGPTHLEEGLIAYDQNQMEEALKHLDDAIKTNPHNTEAHFRRGVIFQKQNKIEEAITAYREVVGIDPNHFKSHYNLGNLYSYEKGNNPQGIVHYRRFLELAPTHPLSPKTQTRLAELTGTPGERPAQGRMVEEGDYLAAAQKNGESLAAPSPTAPPTAAPLPPVAAVPPVLPAPPLAAALPTAPPAPPKPAAPPSEPAGLSFPQVVCVQAETPRGRVEGSGFAIEPGYILASGHQADQASRFTVRLKDGSIHSAALLSVSAALDLALLQIPLQNIPSLPFSEANTGKVGEPVIAVGCPFGLNHSASQGIVSAPERMIGEKPVLQTDVAINPGNSGGPLLSKQGEVIGVVLGMLPEANGIAFAVPAREVKRFLGETFFQIGTLFAESKRHAEAAESLRQSTRFWPKSAKAHNNLGEVYRRMKENRKAEQAFLRALEINPKYADAHYNLGTFYESVLRDPQKAAAHYRKYLALKPASTEAVQVTQWLAAIEGRKGTP